MKKIAYICTAIAILTMVTAGCEKSKTPAASSAPTAAATSGPTATSAPTDAGADNPSGSDEKSNSNSPASSKAPDANSQSGAVQTTDREEIANLIRDAKELIDEGLLDDAKMTLRDLRSRDLTADEKKQVDELQAKLVKISD